jgi:hypothetical protein
METFTALLKQISQIFTWWVSVSPWEQALRVRLGKHVCRLEPGPHLRIPFVDVVFVQSVRLRVASMGMQTVMTKDRKALSVGAAVGYAIENIEQLYQTLHHAQDTITNLAELAIAEAVANRNADELTPKLLSEAATASIGLRDFGLSSVSVRVTDFAFVRTYRLISDTRWGNHGDSLNVQGAQP